MQGNATGGFSPLSLAPSNQLPFTWVKAFNFRLSWVGKIKERFSIEPSVGFYDISTLRILTCLLE